MIPLRDTLRSRHFPIMTWLILLLNLGVFLFETSLSQQELIAFSQRYGLVPGLLQSDPSRFTLSIFTSMFVHAGWFHLISNMWTLFIFADNVEDRMGSIPFLIFYLVTGIAAALLQAVLFPESIIPVIGASGAIAGVLGAYILLFPSARVVTLVPLLIFFTVIQVPAVLYLGFWFLSQLFSGLVSVGSVGGGVAWWAHIGGFLVGLIVSPYFRLRKQPTVEVIPVDPPQYRY